MELKNIENRQGYDLFMEKGLLWNQLDVNVG